MAYLEVFLCLNWYQKLPSDWSRRRDNTGHNTQSNFICNIFFSPLWSIDNYYPWRWQLCNRLQHKYERTYNTMKKDFEIVNKWLKDSGMKVNESKTKMCVFHRLDNPQINLNLKNCKISSINSMNILGVQID
jgi:hypothetical protein